MAQDIGAVVQCSIWSLHRVYMVLSNLVNNKIFRFMKIIPCHVDTDKFEAVVKASSNADHASALFAKRQHDSLAKGKMDRHVSNYYLGKPVGDTEVNAIQVLLRGLVLIFLKFPVMFELQVANHELLGHGSRKSFQGGKLNFNPKKSINPLTGKPIASWYKPGQTLDSALVENPWPKWLALVKHQVTKTDWVNAGSISIPLTASDIEFDSMRKPGLR
ncbi:hypothetical protein ARMGADRAFT_1036523 [Armillaria gallica]|uniref:Uncharacterized protein n=1 Tax=Armillaria gallica TaxID=47427 RepID=A0A2H3CQA0_ARMGA|nr:hypothetical protein ARMGADRAFT_1036523 [Armillaria gallica]